MYAIRSITNPKRIEVIYDGPITDAELARSISQAAALASAGDASVIIADLRRAELDALDADLASATLATKSHLDVRWAVVAAAQHIPTLRRTLRRGRWSSDRAAVFERRGDADLWLGLEKPLDDTGRRHVEHAAAQMKPAPSLGTTKPRRTSAA